MEGAVIVAGSLAQRPGAGGHTWVFLQYLLGFRRLGWDVLFVDRLEPDMCVDARGRPSSVADSENLRYFLSVMRSFGLEDRFSLLGGRGDIGMSREAVLRAASESEFLLNVMGFLTDASILDAAPLRVFLDIDPGFPQMWRALRLADLFSGHDRFVTLAENMGRADCGIPT
jgi:hypothetical protein